MQTIALWVRTSADIVRELQPAPAGVTAHPQPEDKWAWAPLWPLIEDMIRQAFAEAVHRAPKHTKPWVALVDDNRPHLDLLRTVAEADDIKLQSVLNMIHVLGNEWQAAWAFHQPGMLEVEVWVSTRLVQV